MDEAETMRSLITGWVAADLASADWLTQPTHIEQVTAAGLIDFRLASGLLVTIKIQVRRD